MGLKSTAAPPSTTSGNTRTRGLGKMSQTAKENRAQKIIIIILNSNVNRHEAEHAFVLGDVISLLFKLSVLLFR